MKSGFVIIDNSALMESGNLCNHKLLKLLGDFTEPTLLGIESIASFGRGVGSNIFNTCIWIGRFQQAWYDPEGVFLIKRKTIVTGLTGSPKSGDSQVRRHLLRLYEPIGGGKIPQIGIKKQKGPLYGISSHSWQALAVALHLEKVVNLNGEKNDNSRKNV